VINIAGALQLIPGMRTAFSAFSSLEWRLFVLGAFTQAITASIDLAGRRWLATLLNM